MDLTEKVADKPERGNKRTLKARGRSALHGPWLTRKRWICTEETDLDQKVKAKAGLNTVQRQPLAPDLSAESGSLRDTERLSTITGLTVNRTDTGKELFNITLYEMFI